MDFRNIIKIEHNYYILGVNDADNFIGLPQSIYVEKNVKEPEFFLNKTDFDKNNKSNFIMYLYDKVYKDIEDKDIKLPDLSEYNLVDMSS